MADLFLGIDMAKDTAEAALLRGDRYRHHQIANTPDGFASLQAWLLRHGAGTTLHACLEATSTYAFPLATFLHAAGYTVSIVNPYQVKAFAQSELCRTKTDRTDAALLARFCRAHRPEPWQPPAEELTTLQALSRRLDALKGMRAQEQNRLQVPGLVEPVKHSIGVILQAFDQEIAAVERQIEDHYTQHLDLQRNRALLTSIPGVGNITATILLSELGDIRSFANARQVDAYAGLVPTETLSGTSVHGKPHLSKRGNGRLRTALYWPAITARRCNPLFQEFVARHRAVGKKPMVTIAAIMRKLVHIAYGILKSQQPFDPQYAARRA